MYRLLATSAVILALATPSFAQINLGKVREAAKKGAEAKKAIDDYNFSEEEEHQLGADISTKLRDKYGVVQDRAVHKYVSLTGHLLAKASARPGLKWTFIVLDTDGINAFAAPGGFIHITRGALALIQNEAELADVLGHEIGHITEKHTIAAIQGAMRAGLGKKAVASRSEFMGQAVGFGYDSVLENAFDRGDEMEADKAGVTLAAKMGYTPNGMAAFLERLAARNKDAKERSGVFASHPDTKARIDGLAKVITAGKLNASALVAARYKGSINYTLVPVSSVALGGPTTAKPASGGGVLGLAGRDAAGREKSSSQSVSSAGSRGVNTDRDAKGGPNKGLVVVTVTPAELDAFRKGITS